MTLVSGSSKAEQADEAANKKRVLDLPSSLLATSQEGAITVDLAVPASSDSLAVAPADIRDLVRRLGRPVAVEECAVRLRTDGGVGDRLLPPHELAEAASEALEVFLAFFLRHAPSQSTTNGNHGSGVSADEQSLGTSWIGVCASDDVLESVGNAIVELWDTLALSAWHDAWWLDGLKVVEVAIEFLDWCWRWMVEAGKTVEFSYAGLHVDFDGIFAFAFGFGADEGLESLDAAIEG